MKFSHILVYPKTNISRMFLVQRWGLETSSRLFYNFKWQCKETCQFLVVDIYHF